MRRLTEQDVAAVIGQTIAGYRVEAAKINQGPSADSDNYGIILGENPQDEYVTWQFHLMDNGSISVYWGHYIAEREKALRDFEARGIDASQKFYVTVTETFQLTIAVEADSRQEAERIVSGDWQKRKFTLGPECFAGVEFQTEPVEPPK